MKSQQGFTLIELLIVIAILSIFCGVAVVKLNDSIAASDLNAAANQMVIDIRTMQQLSLQKGISGNAADVSMAITAHTYQINNFDAALPVVTMSRNITISVRDAAAGNLLLTYDPYTLSNNRKNMITLTNGTNQQTKTIVLCQDTQRIRIDSSNAPDYRPEEE